MMEAHALCALLQSVIRLGGGRRSRKDIERMIVVAAVVLLTVSQYRHLLKSDAAIDGLFPPKCLEKRNRPKRPIRTVSRLYCS